MASNRQKGSGYLVQGKDLDEIFEPLCGEDPSQEKTNLFAQDDGADLNLRYKSAQDCQNKKVYKTGFGVKRANSFFDLNELFCPIGCDEPVQREPAQTVISTTTTTTPYPIKEIFNSLERRPTKPRKPDKCLPQAVYIPPEVPPELPTTTTTTTTITTSTTTTTNPISTSTTTTTNPISTSTTTTTASSAELTCGSTTTSGGAEVRHISFSIDPGTQYLEVIFDTKFEPDRMCIYEGSKSGLTIADIDGGTDPVADLLYDTGWRSNLGDADAFMDPPAYEAKYPGLRKSPTDQKYCIDTSTWNDSTMKTIVIYGKGQGTQWDIDVKCESGAALCPGSDPASYR